MIAAVITIIVLTQISVFITNIWIKLSRVKILEMVGVYQMEDQIYIL